MNFVFEEELKKLPGKPGVDFQGFAGFEGLPGAFFSRGAALAKAAPAATTAPGGVECLGDFTAACAGGDGQIGIVCPEKLFRLDAIGTGGDGERAVQQVDV